MKQRHVLMAGISAAVMLASLAGCSTQTQLTKEEIAHIKGGPMPPEAAKALAEHRAQWQKTHRPWVGPTPGAPGSPPAVASSSSAPGGPTPGGPPTGGGPDSVH